MKSNTNDYCDAEAIAEAVERENMRFVPIKTEEQLDLQALAPSTGAAGVATDQRNQSDPSVSVGAGRQFTEKARQLASANAGDPGER